jgi:hypothetical protein
MTPTDYADWSKEDLVAEIRKLARRKKYGLVWEEKDEDVALTLNENLPVFEQVKSRAIVSDKKLDRKILYLIQTHKMVKTRWLFTHLFMIQNHLNLHKFEPGPLDCLER